MTTNPAGLAGIRTSGPLAVAALRTACELLEVLAYEQPYDLRSDLARRHLTRLYELEYHRTLNLSVLDSTGVSVWYLVVDQGEPILIGEPAVPGFVAGWVAAKLGPEQARQVASDLAVLVPPAS